MASGRPNILLVVTDEERYAVEGRCVAECRLG
jgi:hypothetical protein